MDCIFVISLLGVAVVACTNGLLRVEFVFSSASYVDWIELVVSEKNLTVAVDEAGSVPLTVYVTYAAGASVTSVIDLRATIKDSVRTEAVLIED